MSAKKAKGDNYIKQGSILAGASLLVRIIGMLYRFPMSNIIGEEGNGIYSVAFEIYDVMLIISSYSLPLAISKLISAKRVRREHRNILRIFRCSMIFALVSGGIAALVLFFGAGFFEKNIAGGKYTGLHLPLRVLAPTVFIVAVMGVLRGVYQGKGSMIPTAISQIIEQVVNAFVSIYAAYSLIQAHNLSAEIAGWGAAGGTMGTLFGAVSGLVFLLFVYIIYKPVLSKMARKDTTGEKDSYTYIYKMILFTSVPIILSQTVYQISGIIDYSIFGSLQSSRGLSDVAVKTATGLYSTKYRLLISVPIAIATAMSSSILPSVVASYEIGDTNGLNSKISLGLKFNLLIAFPCFAGLSVLAQPILKMLYPSQDYVTGGYLLTIGGIAVVFYAISNITGAVLQGINKMRLPVIHSAIALGVHIAVVVILLYATDMGILALVVGNIVFPAVTGLLNMISIYKYTTYRQEYSRTFGVPIIASAVMSAACFAVYYGISSVWPHNTILVMLAVAAAVVVYFAMYFILGGATKEEIYEFPMGARIVRLASKFHLI
ncbi:MAG: polysaccharide biosynthesis protein [Lachnospiraceae bacterium]|nr:polysaccharide biosynthesis protein [Lachnospiraceae bacterium]